MRGKNQNAIYPRPMRIARNTRYSLDQRMSSWKMRKHVKRETAQMLEKQQKGTPRNGAIAAKQQCARKEITFCAYWAQNSRLGVAKCVRS